MKILDETRKKFQSKKKEVITLEEFLQKCKTDHSMYMNAAERLLHGIGDPVILDVDKDPKLKRRFSNEDVKVYPAFSNFYGLEKPIQDLVSVIKHSAQGLEESKQTIYLLGPPGGGKSDILRTLVRCFEKVPFYALADTDGNLSPVLDNPLCLFGEEDSVGLGIPARYFDIIASPWVTKRLDEYAGDISKFKVVKLFPDKLSQTAISKVEPGDEQNQDISALVGKIDIRKLREFSRSDTDCYDYSGGLCKGNRGIVEYVEMFKAPIKTLNPLLTATQDKNYKGTEAMASIPFDGLIIAHSNESEWNEFKNNKRNEAFIDRICTVKVPYVLAVDEEVKIYEKLLADSSLSEAPCSPRTLKSLAEVSVLSRLSHSSGDELETKMKVYNGEDLKDRMNSVKPIHEYKEEAGVMEGFTGLSTRFAFKVLSKTFNFDRDEVAANPVHLFSVLRSQVKDEQLPAEREELLLAFVKFEAIQYKDFIERDIKQAYLGSHGDDFCQNLFDMYVEKAEHRLEDDDYRDPVTNQVMNEAALEKWLREIEEPSGVTNVNDFRNDIVKFCLKHRASNKGRNPKWSSYAKMRDVIEKKVFSNIEDLLPVISFSSQISKKNEDKHHEFVESMMKKGYTAKQVQIVVEWYINAIKR